MGPLVLSCLGAGQKNCSVRRPRCALGSLLRAWTGAFFPGLGFPGILWLPEVSALPSWYLAWFPSWGLASQEVTLCASWVGGQALGWG